MDVGIFRAKYSYEFKKKVVMTYLDGKGGKKYLAKKYGIASPHHIIEWVNSYKTLGDDGLKRSRKNEVYSFEKKLSVVELYSSSEISYQDLALQEGITNPSMIAAWVNEFRATDPDALRPHKRGRKKTLDKSDNNTQRKPLEESTVDTSAKHVRELEDELFKLRKENAFLKESRRLRLEGKARMRERFESLTISEDNSI